MLQFLRDSLARLGTAPAALNVPNDGRPLFSLRAIQGGDAAPELGMMPVDWDKVDIIPHRSVVQVKGDGIRALYIDGQIYSRQGVPLNCAAHCQPGLARLEKWMGEPTVFDGEYIALDGYNATLAEMGKGEGSGCFWIFDAIPLEDWRADNGLIRIEQRLERIARALPHAESSFIGMFDYWLLGANEIEAKARELWALGYEGVVAKKARSFYRRRRSAEWLRLKQVVTIDCTILDMAKNWNGQLRSIIVKTPAGKTLKVPTGWTKEEGAALLAAFAHLAGSVVEIAFNPKQDGGERGIRFVRLRPDKGTAA